MRHAGEVVVVAVAHGHWLGCCPSPGPGRRRGTCSGEQTAAAVVVVVGGGHSKQRGNLRPDDVVHCCRVSLWSN